MLKTGLLEADEEGRVRVGDDAPALGAAETLGDGDGELQGQVDGAYVTIEEGALVKANCSD